MTAKNINEVATLRNELTAAAETAKNRYEKTLSAMAAHLAVNPASALTWKAHDMVVAQTQHEVWARIASEIAGHEVEAVEVEAVLAAASNDANYRVRAFFGSNSTSMFDNAVERARGAAYVRIAEELERIRRHHKI